MNLLEIQKASLADSQSLFALEKRVFDYDILMLRQLRYLIKSKTALVVKGVINKDIVGYMVLLTRKNSNVLRIYSLGIVSVERRLGFGKILLRYAEKHGAEKGLERIHLELHVKNTPALLFYLSEGYSLYGRRDNYYSDGGGALLLRKSILPQDLP